MISFLLAPQNLPFSVALTVMAVIALMEGVGLILGAGISNLFEQLVPGIDFESPDLPEFNNASGMTKFLGWLRIGQVPILVTLIIFLTIFGLSGLILQSIAETFTGSLLPGTVAAVPVFFLTLPILRTTHSIVAKIIPKDETYAVGEEAFIGRIATITNGTATNLRAAQARLLDEHNRTHYVMVKSDIGEETLPAGTSVLLVSRTGGFFNVIKNPNPNLIDPES